MAESKVLFATGDVTVHKLVNKEKGQFGDYENVEALVVRQGETFPVDDLASYQKDDVEAGTFPNVEVLSADAAEKKAAEHAMLVAAVSGPTIQTSTVGYTGPDADDGSHSDHLVEDAERQENLANEAKADNAGDTSGKGGKTPESTK